VNNSETDFIEKIFRSIEEIWWVDCDAERTLRRQIWTNNEIKLRGCYYL